MAIASVAMAADFVAPARGTVFTDHMDVGGGKMIPLPPGEWILVGYGLTTSEGGARFFSPHLLQLKGNVVVGLVEAASALEGPRLLNYGGGYVFNRDCERVDVVYRERLNNYEGGPQDCWRVTHASMVLGSHPAQGTLERYKYVEEHNLVLPSDMLKVQFHFANKIPQFLDASYGFNPELDGVKGNSNSWRRERIYKDQKKVDYIQRLIDWGKAWHDRVRDGAQGKLASAQNSPAR
jgi:hypothetical protein